MNMVIGHYEHGQDQKITVPSMTMNAGKHRRWVTPQSMNHLFEAARVQRHRPLSRIGNQVILQVAQPSLHIIDVHEAG